MWYDKSAVRSSQGLAALRPKPFPTPHESMNAFLQTSSTSANPEPEYTGQYAVSYEDTLVHDDGYGDNMTSRFNVMKVFNDYQAFADWVIENQQHHRPFDFKAFRVQPLKVQTTVQVHTSVTVG